MVKRTTIQACWAFVLKVFVTLSLGIGVGFIAFGCVLQTPPSAPVPGALVAAGVFTLLGCIFGFFGANHNEICLKIYLGFSACTTFWQFVLICFVVAQPDKVIDEILRYERVEKMASNYNMERADIASKLDSGKAVFMLFILINIISLITATVMFFMGPLVRPYDGLENGMTEEDAKRMVELEGVSKSVSSRSGKASNKGADRIASKMDKKYGTASQEDFMEGRRWYNIF